MFESGGLYAVGIMHSTDALWARELTNVERTESEAKRYVSDFLSDRGHHLCGSDEEVQKAMLLS